MWRKLHRWPTLVLGLLVVFLACTGSILAVEPVLDRFDRHVADPGAMTVGDLLRKTAKANPYFVIDRIRVDGAGRVMLRGADSGGSREVSVNLAAGRLGRVVQQNDLMEFVRKLHRNLALGPQGRPVTLAGVLAMALLMVSGLWLLQRRLGGWRAMVLPLRGHGLDKWHAVLGRLLILPLAVTVASGLWLSLVSNGLVSSGAESLPPGPQTRIEAAPVPVTDLAIWDKVPLAGLTELTFPIQADWFDVYRLRQGDVFSFIDRQSGEILATAPVPGMVRLMDLFVLLHTGQGAAPWAAVAGLVALSVPFFAVTGVILWARRHTSRARGTVRPGLADVAILVGSESGTTWGFAAHLAQRLMAQGRRVYLGSLAPLTLRSEADLLILTATYGDGTPPANAGSFLTALPKLTGAQRFAVLGFGDKSFPAYCAFAMACQAALEASGRAALLPMGDVNRRSAQSFAAWGRALGPAIGLPGLTLDHSPPRPATRDLVLESRQDFGTEAGSAAILRFRPAKGALPRFAAGDLLAILPPADPVARLYSLASSSHEGFVELCVARVEGGVCSNFLMDMAPGDRMAAHVSPNPDFRPARRGPTVMIGAGTGIAPFAGMIRANRKRPLDLFFGLRHPEADFYWREDLAAWTAEGRLSALHSAFSRHGGREYVQDRLRAEAEGVAARLRAPFAARSSETRKLLGRHRSRRIAEQAMQINRGKERRQFCQTTAPHNRPAPKAVISIGPGGSGPSAARHDNASGMVAAEELPWRASVPRASARSSPSRAATWARMRPLA